MYIEYACYDHTLSDEQIKTNITTAVKFGIKNIATYSNNLPLIKNLFPDLSTLSFSCPIDFPCGTSDLKSRNLMVSQAIKAGANTIDLVIPSKYIVNRKYDKLREDIKSNLAICNEAGVELRYILEYRVFNHETLAKTCQILKTLQVQSVFPATGNMIDDVNDNIIAAKYLSSKSEIQTIINGNIWTTKHAETIKNSGSYGVRLHHLASLRLFIKNNAS